MATTTSHDTSIHYATYMVQEWYIHGTRMVRGRGIYSTWYVVPVNNNLYCYMVLNGTYMARKWYKNNWYVVYNGTVLVVPRNITRTQ